MKYIWQYIALIYWNRRSNGFNESNMWPSISLYPSTWVPLLFRGPDSISLYRSSFELPLLVFLVLVLLKLYPIWRDAWHMRLVSGQSGLLQQPVTLHSFIIPKDYKCRLCKCVCSGRFKKFTYLYYYFIDICMIKNVCTLYGMSHRGGAAS